VIGILDYGMGNLSSVYNSLSYLGFDSMIIKEASQIDVSLTHLIVPGVGSYSNAMFNLKEKGFDSAIYKYIDSGRPYLGICLGMQLLSTLGHEDGETKGLNLIEGEVLPLQIKLHTPHVGWNSIECQKQHPVFDGHTNHLDFYFVHSYFYKANNNEDVLATTEYEKEFCSVVARNNILGVQFHPEKSQEPGLSLMAKFCEWDGKC
jgi:imidazole glycerol-phosphate synthase subunit HisH